MDLRNVPLMKSEKSALRLVWAGNTYTEADKNKDLYYDERFLRTGDLGRIDSDQYLWITGRAKDLIIRGGHNIDPALIEEALLGHEAVAFAGAIGQPDQKAGELPCVYVELVAGAAATTEELQAYCAESIPERAAHPKYVELVDELPKTRRQILSRRCAKWPSHAFRCSPFRGELRRACC